MAATVLPSPAAGAAAGPAGRRSVETAGGRRIAYVQEGAGPDVVLIHGARIEWLPGIGHMLHHARSEAVVEAVAALLDR